MSSSGTELTRPTQIPAVATALRVMVAVVVLHGILALVTFVDLPAEIPLHFNADGIADHHGPPTVGSWFSVFFTSAATALMIVAIVLSIYRIPTKYLSVPRKQEYLKLPLNTQRRLMGIIALHTLVLGATMSLVFALLQLTMALTAHGVMKTFPAWILFVALGLMIAEVVLLVISFSRGLDDAILESARSGFAN